jgi:hypothetical protein
MRMNHIYDEKSCIIQSYKDHKSIHDVLDDILISVCSTCEENAGK